MVLLAVPLAAQDQDKTNLREIKDLNKDLDEYLTLAKQRDFGFYSEIITNMAVQNLYRQRAIWKESHFQDDSIRDVYTQSLIKFINVAFYLENPNWADFGLLNLETLDSFYTAYIDTSSDKTYGECLSFIKHQWLETFAQINTFNELLGPDELRNNRITLLSMDRFLSYEDSLLIMRAENYIKHWMNGDYRQWFSVYREDQQVFPKEWFTFFIPEGKYKFVDIESKMYPKGFDAVIASRDEAQFLYLTLNDCFDFVPIATIYSKDGITFDTLGAQDFEMIKLKEGRVDKLDNLEFGRYYIRVNPPYQLIDSNRVKLFIPKWAYGQEYAKKYEAVFDEHAAELVKVDFPGREARVEDMKDTIYLSNKAKYNYEGKIIWVKPGADTDLEDLAKK
jgi:hypothetical protein